MLSTSTVTEPAIRGHAPRPGPAGWFLGAVAAGAILALIGLRWGVKTGATASGPPPVSGQLRPASWPSNAITVGYLGHATLLIDYLGVRVISDPTFFHRVGLDVGHLFTVGPVRHAPVPLEPAAIPPLDLILITHAHMDHLDLPSLRALPKNATVVSCAGCRDLIEPLGYTDVRPLKWGESTVVHGLKITAMGARHWGRRWPWEADRGYNSYVIEKDGIRMLIACDSAFTPLFSQLHDDPPLIAAFSIGAYDPWIRNHANPEQVWEMFRESGARYLVPIHWGTFRLSKEPMDEPLRRLIRDAGPRSNAIVIRNVGGDFQLSAPMLRQASFASQPRRKIVQDSSDSSQSKPEADP
ncbi:MAG TPA: MBL fold metallo-hydrolase [Candidatus Binataceae bacterium]|jgi:L-ascorbate metabolism protein UlaG (beta-lactamase superfamily)|nr:MBL fold metallo-hydrolase [Candidatus Binataceae bacterium]